VTAIDPRINDVLQKFVQEIRSAVARWPKVFTSRENVEVSREGLQCVAAGTSGLGPGVANSRFEGTPTHNHEEFLQQKPIDKVGSGGVLPIDLPNVRLIRTRT
jgi:hypothetical protein